MISICVPTYNSSQVPEYNGVTMIRDLFKSLEIQTYTDFEVIVSDHSENSDIERFVEFWKDRLDIKYYRFEERRGSSEANLNNAMRNACGSLIKPLYQDDYLYSKDSLQIFIDEYTSSNNEWMVGGFTHIEENDKNVYINTIFPHIRDLEAMMLGENRLGSPSNILFKRNSNMFFDENLGWLSDSEFYYRMIKLYGAPFFSKTILCITRLRASGGTNTLITPKLKEEEQNYCKDKHIREIEMNLNNYPNLLWNKFT